MKNRRLLGGANLASPALRRRELLCGGLLRFGPAVACADMAPSSTSPYLSAEIEAKSI